MLQLFAFEAASNFAVFLKYENNVKVSKRISLIETSEKCLYDFALLSISKEYIIHPVATKYLPAMNHH